jgi:hypothetical protein
MNFAFNIKHVCLQLLRLPYYFEFVDQRFITVNEIIDVFVGIILEKYYKDDSGDKNSQQIKQEMIIAHESVFYRLPFLSGKSLLSTGLFMYLKYSRQKIKIEAASSTIKMII